MYEDYQDYDGSGVCPACGGVVVEEDGWHTCVGPGGSCLWSKEVE